MNVNAGKLAALIEKDDKRLKRLREGAPGEQVPRTTMLGNARGQVPSLRHAATYKRVLKLRFEDWLVPVQVPS